MYRTAAVCAICIEQVLVPSVSVQATIAQIKYCVPPQCVETFTQLLVI